MSSTLRHVTCQLLARGLQSDGIQIRELQYDDIAGALVASVLAEPDLDRSVEFVKRLLPLIEEAGAAREALARPLTL